MALKVLPDDLADDPGRRRRFEREARAVATLAHPHICTLFDVGHDGNRDFLVMELLDGKTLAATLEDGPLPVDKVLRHGREIAEALAEAHRHGIIASAGRSRAAVAPSRAGAGTAASSSSSRPTGG